MNGIKPGDLCILFRENGRVLVEHRDPCIYHRSGVVTDTAGGLVRETGAEDKAVNA